MWIFKNDAFVSIVEDKDMADQLWVRARQKGDLERFFNDADWLEVIETPDADYRFRCAVDRQIVKMALIHAVDQLCYTNFKNSIAGNKAGDRRHSAYLRVWTAMWNWQKEEVGMRLQAAKRKKGKKKGAQS